MTETTLGTQHAKALIDNGRFGTREVGFSTGRLARQAAGSALAQLGDTVVLSATTASKQPKEQFDFFPLTVDVEERMYAAGRIPGSFFRREGRPSEDAILTCRLIDRPLRPSFVKGLRNEVQVVATVLALDPDHPYDVVAINAASMSTQLSGLPFCGPIGATRMAHVEGEWVAFPTYDELERGHLRHGRGRPGAAGRRRRDHDGRGGGHRAHDRADRRRRHRADRGGRGERAGGGEAGHPRAVPGAGRAGRGGRQADQGVPDLPGLRATTSTTRSRPRSRDEVAEALRIAGKRSGRTRSTGSRTRAYERVGAQFEGREKEIGAAFRALTKKQVRPRVLRDQVRIDGRGPRDIRPLTAEVEVLPRVHGSALFERGETQILGVTTLNMLRHGADSWTRSRRRSPGATCTTTTSRRTRPVRPAGSARRSGARSATARSPSGR